MFHPVTAISRVIASGLRACFRRLRDTITWPILYWTGRTPTTSNDTWLAYRTHGPGLASETYFRLPLWSAKTAVLYKLDAIRLALHDQLRKHELDQPYSTYTQSFSCFEHLGMACSPLVQNPSKQGKAISSAFLQNLAKSMQSIQNIDVTCASETHAQMCFPIKEVDAEIVKYLAQHNDITTHISDWHTDSPLTLIVRSIVPTYATWLAQKKYRQMLLGNVVNLPAEVLGRFRLSNDELDHLWQFTLDQVQRYTLLIQTELEKIAEESPWLTNLDVIATIHAFNHKTESVAVLAVNLLRKLF